ncbi:helix-turn-helix transcriptional regulator [Nonomuraea sp. NPDC050404]|uniref:helix-turn-helix domain-containing protein n=1 Tax=Nonomuraea sp. NPDC050404 TaxID=3155783 RepID=UPI0034095952
MTLDPDQLGRSKQDLAESLKNLRLQAGLTGVRLARLCSMSQSKVSKIETGKITPSATDVASILHAVGAPQEIISEVTALARMANTEWQDNRSSWRRGLEKRQSELATLEAGATELRYFLPSMITALLATPEYIRASLTGRPVDTSKTISKKIERQAVLYDESKSFTFILTEQAIRWGIVSAHAMAVQIERLASLSHLPTVRIGVVPFSVELPRGPLNTFTVYDDRLATVETFTGRIVFQDFRDIAQHRQIFDMYENIAVFDEDCRGHLQEWTAAYRRNT